MYVTISMCIHGFALNVTVEVLSGIFYKIRQTMIHTRQKMPRSNCWHLYNNAQTNKSPYIIYLLLLGWTIRFYLFCLFILVLPSVYLITPTIRSVV